ncbi:MAG: class B sortase [Clostridiales bacterium]|nr:class B sortase [Clostridiales bacterium]
MAKEIRKWAALSLSLICFGVAAYFGGRLLYAALEYQEGDELYERMAESAVAEPVENGDNGEPDESPVPVTSESVSEISEAPAVDFNALQEINPEIVAWLYCPDDENTIIYGHHMASGKMFASLIRYAEQEYYEAHPVMYLNVEGKTYLLELFAGYTTAEASSAYRMQLDTSHEFAEWMREISAKSDFTANIRLTTEDRIITLSTCAYSFENARYVVHGRLVELVEAAE